MKKTKPKEWQKTPSSLFQMGNVCANTFCFLPNAGLGMAMIGAKERGEGGRGLPLPPPQCALKDVLSRDLQPDCTTSLSPTAPPPAQTPPGMPAAWRLYIDTSDYFLDSLQITQC